jgi:nitroreductase/NAD-dependent dihydropyrimidine dehydrogenase PreA subunit
MALDEKLRGMFRPTTHWGRIEVDADKCTGCGQCVDNCPGKVPAVGDDGIAYMSMKECFSCSNCAVTCPEEAITLVESFYVEDGFYTTTPADIPCRPPAQALDADGVPTKYTPTEKAILERRSVRNFEDKPVPESLLRRLLEAGRMAPSTGNCQPWRFIVITDKELLAEIAERIQQLAQMATMMYQDDDMLEALAAQYETDPQPGLYDPRVQFGIKAVAEGRLPALVDAPAFILMLGDERAISAPEINIGICGSNINYVANSLGLGSCWIGFVALVNMIPDLMQKLGIEEPYKAVCGMSVGYPRFKQSGMVAREAKPVTWFRPGGSGPEVEK